MTRRAGWALSVLVCWAPLAAAAEVDFERSIAPVLVRHCAGCHNPSDPAGGLNLMDRAAALAGGESGEPAIVPGDPQKGNLLARLRAAEMPPAGKGQPVAPGDQALLESWIAAGAPWPADRTLSPFEFTSATRAGRDWWSLAPIRRPPLPAPADSSRIRGAIDVFVVEKLAARGLTLSADADRATLIRRATLDVTGLPPSPEDLERFVADPAPDAYERLVDRLLASPRYGERWARHWLDVVRFGESNGYETNGPRANAWPYRDWVIGALNSDLDYRRFILEQLAGDQVGVDAATGFLVGGAHDVVFSPDIELTLQQRMNDLDDMISTTSGAFLGLTVSCAKCHDHKFDPIAQRDYYALQAMFAGVEHGERAMRTPGGECMLRERERIGEQLAAARAQSVQLWMRHQPLARVDDPAAGTSRFAVRPMLNVDRFAPVAARMVRFTVLATNQFEPCLDELEVFGAEHPEHNVALVSAGGRATASGVYANGDSPLHRLEHINDGQFGNARSWISSEVGAGWVTIEWPETTLVDHVVWARDREEKFRDRLPTRYKIEVSTSGSDWQLVATSDDRRPPAEGDDSAQLLATEGLPTGIAEQLLTYQRQIESLSDQLKKLAPPMVYGGTFKQPEATHVLYRGEPLAKREEVSPGSIGAIRPSLALDAGVPESQRRLALARWIGGDDNPLTPRVIVNRVWHYHFGQGLVSTPSDLGWGGGQPSHPDLLDWLADEFKRQGWRLKPLHRAILLSSTYRQASVPNAQAAAIDAGDRLLWRYAPRRLEAEAIRDGVLSTSGVLDLGMGGPGYEVFEPNTNYVKVYTPKQSFTPADWRRMIYQDKPRLQQDSTFGAFDCPDASQAAPRRNSSTTALQALNLLNGPFLLQQANMFAARLQREAPADEDAQVRRAFMLAFGRAADDEELAAARRLVASGGLAALCHVLFNANEFLYVN